MTAIELLEYIRGGLQEAEGSLDERAAADEVNFNHYYEAIDQLKAELAKPEPISDAVKILCKRYGTSLAEIALDLEAENEQHRWIPISERLPEKSGNYQVVRAINRLPTTREYCADSLMWLSHDTVTHWKPIILPQQVLKGDTNEQGD